MKILLTGASGYLGHHVLAYLRQQGCDVVMLGRSRPVGYEDVPLMHCDLLNGSNLVEAVQQVGATHLMHLAWTTEHGVYWASPLIFVGPMLRCACCRPLPTQVAGTLPSQAPVLNMTGRKEP